MSREIKFRFITPWGEDILTLEELIDLGEEVGSSQFENRGQYTGLKDKTGKEIYEGDIIKNYWYNCNGKFIGGLYVVKFGEHLTSLDYYACAAYGWYAANNEETHTLHNLPQDNGIEVIGNIHENPELLNE